MTKRERFTSVMNFKLPDDRMPMMEWAPWWNQTIQRWQGEGLPSNLQGQEIAEYFGLDRLFSFGPPLRTAEFPKPVSHGAGVINEKTSYDDIRKFLFTDELIERCKGAALNLKEKHEQGEYAVRFGMDGFFWFPRTLFGITEHLFAFYDCPELMHRINGDLADFWLRTMEVIFPILKPDMVGISEDMSYNHGPMLSKELFDEFVGAYYKKVVPFIKQYDIKILVDSDGDITKMIPWLTEAGIDGVYPLERQAGVDVVQIRKDYPDFIMLGAYDKMVMSKGESQIREEFERLLPVMRTGGFIPSVDHQTPPEVSLENYRLYLRLFEEYCVKAVK